MAEPRDLTIYRAAELLRRGELTATALLRSCLERIDAREPLVRAWAALHREEALQHAELLDREAARSRWHGPLHGIPFGIKDIIDVRGMETRNGCEAYPPRPAAADAAAVSRLREAGALLLGKTHTAALAYIDPPPTRNPWHPDHTPGGSSSGSGAAVGDRMCLGALGTQTGGSVLRPAAYNGAVGFKPGHGRIPVAGVLTFSWLLDHVGTFSRAVEDAALLWRLLREEAPVDWQASRDRLPPPVVPRAPLRVWRLRGAFEQQAEPEMREAFERACRQLARAGVALVEQPLPAGFEAIQAVHHTISSVEAATVHRDRFRAAPAGFPPLVTKLLAGAQGVSGVEYVAALRERHRLRLAFHAAMAGLDAALLPTTPGPAPDLSTTGNAAFNRPWSLCGVPTLTLPIGLSGEGLPLGLQLVGVDGGEDALLGISAWCESQLPFPHAPG